MTPERWRQITRIFHAARAAEPSARESILREACADDASLRDEVERMLAHDAGTTLGTFGPGEPAAAEWLPGAQFGPYRVEALAGAGGMGEVYRATDTRLRRTVAIKVLAPQLASDPEWLGRFEREAQMLAALNHPHIAAIHGIEELDGRRALVLEFVEGRTLEEAIEGGARPLSETLAVARQIAEALEAAHGRGIIHRDLKPSNIAITRSGTVKVLDFGIAKADAGADGEHGAFTHTATREGFVLGTAAYMSPEQARGQTVDKRADIWAFGCVLYEMLTGRQPFDGDTRSDTIARVLEREPDWTALPADTPDSIRRLVRRCLAKDPAQRLHDIADARLEIADTVEKPLPQALTIHPRRQSIWMAIAVVIPIVAVVAWWAIAGRSNGPAAAPAVEFGVHFPENHIPAFGVAVSPDGQRIAAGVFGSAVQLYLHSLDTGETRPLAGTQTALWPFWSPDGSRLGYFTSARELRVMDPASGVSTLVCPIPAGAAGGTWNRDGTIVFAANLQLFSVPANGGTPVALTLTEPAGEPSFPQFLPDQRHFIYFAAASVGGSVMLASLDSTAVTRLIDSEAVARFAAPDRLLIVRGAALLAYRFDPTRGTLSGKPVVVARGVSAGVVGSRPLFSAAGTTLAIATARGGSAGQLTWFDRAGHATGVLDQPAGDEYLNPALSPDGALVAANRIDPATGNWDVWLVDTVRGPARFTADAARDSDPIWSPDGREIVFASNRGGTPGLYRKVVNGSEPEERILEVPGIGGLVPTDWTADGKYVVYSRVGLSGPSPWSVWALQLPERKSILVIDGTFVPLSAHVSPDGRWLAYSSFETGRQEIYVQRFLAPGQKQKVSEGGGVHPRWTRDGRELVYWAVPGGIQAVDFTSTGSSFQIGARRTIVQSPVLSAIDGRTHYDVTRDGSRLLVRRAAGPQGAGITVVLNWMARLGER